MIPFYLINLIVVIFLSSVAIKVVQSQTWVFWLSQLYSMSGASQGSRFFFSISLSGQFPANLRQPIAFFLCEEHFRLTSFASYSNPIWTQKNLNH